ncbi:Kynurenine 3-monooxygenase [Actinidia chinensis var. chinensis]|uniref:Uncharacterized protein n=2 Tax=Actinidia TaxID=3624 RepID=A0A7J0H2S8_9ERIC|nr:Kynurenine 3-monooxygenase [Actinidia chinensis var. chinensis]GFZ17374.1 hypothetical protein Acr_26g0006440 [Actinidia rufa]GFZ17386.1 hypothetical protein Acr_26g0006560 [Actinidia rufa]
MQRGSDYFNRQHGWDTTSHDYHSHISRVARMPSVLTDVPQYPNVHMIFNNKVATKPEDVAQQKHHDPPQATTHKKVQFVETTGIDKSRTTTRETACEKTIDEEADGFIQQRRKNFELCKWATYRES